MQQGFPQPEDEIEEAAQAHEENWQAKAEEFKDKWMRTAADYDNYVKRQQRDRAKNEMDMRIQVLRELLPPMDDLDRALAHTPADLEDNAWVQGVILIEKKFKAVLEHFRVKPIQAVGQPFDPNYHEALMTEPSDRPEGEVLEEFKKGYMLDDQVVRVASVKTSSGPAE
ncbi:MAG: nucleotide exchange factor GrpE [Chloroflexi bacterium]|nr:nucleotide exchange factor GrpE [Chloroflexota bacterium]